MGIILTYSFSPAAHLAAVPHAILLPGQNCLRARTTVYRTSSGEAGLYLMLLKAIIC